MEGESTYHSGEMARCKYMLTSYSICAQESGVNPFQKAAETRVGRPRSPRSKMNNSLFSGNSRPAGDPSTFTEEPCAFHKLMMEHFLSLVGGVVDYYGADGGECEFKIDSMVFKVLEDPDDGYRSYLGTIEYAADSEGIFFPNPIARVKIESFEDETSTDPEDFTGSGTCEGYRLIDIEDDHVWLEFGTANTSDYYPYFIFRHIPKPS